LPFKVAPAVADLVEGAEAATIDMYHHKATAYEWHARTLAFVGKPDEAREAAATALAIYETKGDVPASAWARELVDSLAEKS
jgi:hypothetical protein